MQRDGGAAPCDCIAEKRHQVAILFEGEGLTGVPVFARNPGPFVADGKRHVARQMGNWSHTS